MSYPVPVTVLVNIAPLTIIFTKRQCDLCMILSLKNSHKGINLSVNPSLASEGTGKYNLDLETSH